MPKLNNKESRDGGDSGVGIVTDYHGNISFYGTEEYKAAIELLSVRADTTQGKLVRVALDLVYGPEISRLLSRDVSRIDDHDKIETFISRFVVRTHPQNAE